MNLQEREQGLLNLVDEYREGECRKLLAAAESEASARLHATFRRERSRLRERIDAERAHARARVQAARAEHDTRERAGADRANARLLELAWPRLRETLRLRWQDRAARGAWVGRAAEQAFQALPSGVWTIRFATGWDSAERRALALEIGARGGAQPHFVPDESLAAGLIIQAADAVLDASLEGLLGDRIRIEARLLALLRNRVGR